MKKVRVAVIGCGVIGPTHLSCYQNNPHAQIVATCDLVEEKAKAAAERFGALSWTTRVADVFADPAVDAVSICTDHASHAALACAALAAGKHVLCEKPLARTPADLAKMLAAAKAHPELVASGVFQHRFEPMPRELRKVIAEGKLGTLLTVSGLHNCHRSAEYFRADAWRGTMKGEGGSVLINQSIHFFDQLIWLVGGIRRIRSLQANLGHRGIIETEDTLAAALEFDCGALGTYLCTNASHQNWTWRLAFDGTRGTVVIHDNAIERCEFADAKTQASVRARLEKALNIRADAKGKVYYGEGHQGQIDDFVRAVSGGKAPYVSFASAAETVRWVFAAYQSAKR